MVEMMVSSRKIVVVGGFKITPSRVVWPQPFNILVGKCSDATRLERTHFFYCRQRGVGLGLGLSAAIGFCPQCPRLPFAFTNFFGPPHWELPLQRTSQRRLQLRNHPKLPTLHTAEF